ncbi:acyl carrier protein [Nonomuraea sp. NBC_01738]|uniref:acyl carrier protein n=1 Tax=Nonomuraea sp. NBC_01738 TaxID=2976003 RepID=UPI002E0E2153|nr:acyl carrier protein [Nonomuraea sp. NBC_01738]
MSTITLADLKEIMRTSIGVEEGVDLDGDIADVTFADLGYDSLAVLELISQVERRYEVPIPDEALSEMPTPAAAIDYLAALLTRTGV